ncbi:hypothetical protein STPL106120_09915 [Streptococcus pluranimalium]
MSYLEEGQSISSLAGQYDVSDTTIKDWSRKYQQDGIEGLKESHTWKKYSHELKCQAVRDYLEGKASQESIIMTYRISSKSVLQKWIKQYASGKEITSTSKGLTRMKQGRKTTFEERVAIVNLPLPIIKTIKRRLRSTVFLTNRSIHGYGSLRREVQTAC